MESMNIETLIFAYLVICASMILFNIVSIFAFDQKERKLNKRSFHFERQVTEQFERTVRGEHVSEEHKRYLAKKLRRVSNLMAFDETMERLKNQNPDKESAYLEEMNPVFVDLMYRYQKKNELKAAYFSYILQKYAIIQNKNIKTINEALLGYIKKSNLYCRENALKALYSTGSVEYVMKALKILEYDRNTYYSPKLLSDGLLTFAGSHEELITEIWNQFSIFSVEKKVALLNYIRFYSGAYCERMLDVLKEEAQDAEVHYACIRYFGKYPDGKAYPLLVSYVEHEKERTWEYAAVAAAALAAYPGKQTTAVLKKGVCSRNWYVRLNAAKSLNFLGMEYDDLKDVFEGDDQYAKEILFYQLDINRMQKEEAAVV